MPLRRQLLNILSDGAFHSGEALGSQLDVSRMAVWKHIRALRQAGIPLEVVKGRGYRLPQAVEMLDSDMIESGVCTATRNQLSIIETLLEVDSTNSRLRRAALEGADSGTVCLAELQHTGRGRHNRNWVSPFAANLYLSLLWRSADGASGIGGLSLATGIAIVRCLETFGIKSAGLKWPNDILVDGAKVAGILIDVVGESTGPCAVIIGIGINVSMPQDAAAGIDQHWTDLYTLTGLERFPRNRLAAGVLDAVFAAIGEFAQSGMESFLEEWRRLDLIDGRQVNLHMASEVIPGTACGIDSAGALLVDTATGRRRFASGEVSLRVAP
ncbi:MAG: bifunctional biotin--[acetyl-CoA-carboxylase] ligase/biotin operon repressor BirA [Gammaproteobacteria bacterium]|nr:MAG: bifunctional biotin--[acetyl-CoA-carboxylase] ligase/biotin operon repressor BirA [Gammaproteobacteria bacterium]